jgi:hypothetical protein
VVEELPDWASSVDELTSFVVNAHGLACNIPKEGATGRSVHIGIIDSANRLQDFLTEGYTVRQGRNHSFLETDEDETYPHCSAVFSLASSFCPEATFSLYQAVTVVEGVVEGVECLLKPRSACIRQ